MRARCRDERSVGSGEAPRRIPCRGTAVADADDARSRMEHETGRIVLPNVAKVLGAVALVSFGTGYW